MIRQKQIMRLHNHTYHVHPRAGEFCFPPLMIDGEIDGLWALATEAFPLISSGDGIALEIGAAVGGSAITICRALLAAGIPKDELRFVSVDPFNLGYFQDQFARYTHNLAFAGLSQNVVPFRYRAEEIEKEWTQPIAFLFIDGDHTREQVVLDNAWTRHVIPGGIVAWHDCEPRFQPMWDEIERFIEADPKLKRIGNYHSIIAARVVG